MHGGPLGGLVRPAILAVTVLFTGASDSAGG